LTPNKSSANKSSPGMSKVQDCDDLSCSLGFVNPDAEAEKEMTI
jgi:hypothetical protein